MAEIIKRFLTPTRFAFVVDLEADDIMLPAGWEFVLEDNAYTGWSGGHGCVRWAEVRPTNKMALLRIVRDNGLTFDDADLAFIMEEYL